jgi:hypothetical protein
VGEEVQGAGRDRVAILLDGREATAEVRQPLDQEDRLPAPCRDCRREKAAKPPADDDDVAGSYLTFPRPATGQMTST